MDIGDLYTTLGFPHRQGSLQDAEWSFWVEPLMLSVKLIAGCSDEEQGVHTLDGKLPGPPQRQHCERDSCATHPLGNTFLCILCARWSGQCGGA